MRSGYRCAVVNDARGTLLEIRGQVQSELTSYLALQREYLGAIGSELIPVCDALESFLLEGGKRLRPLFAYAGFSATGATATAADIRAFTSLELLQACALIHDDLMDRSDTRRGKPAIHRHFENLHQTQAMNGLSDQFGEAAAVLLGDLALVWSDHLLHTSGVTNDALLSALSVHDEMRIELMAGQYLDVREAGEKSPSVDRSLRIARYKSGKYTIERPLHLGAALAIKDPTERKALTDQQTKAKLSAALGREDLSSADIEEVRALITATGAVKDVEDLIDGLLSNALTAANSDEIAPSARELLIELATSAIRRSH